MTALKDMTIGDLKKARAKQKKDRLGATNDVYVAVRKLNNINRWIRKREKEVE